MLEVVIALFLPPLAVFLKRGFGRPFWLSIVLTLLGHLPGVVYAIYVVTAEGRVAAAA